MIVSLMLYEHESYRPSVVVGGRVVRLELRKASLATLAASLLSSLSSSISQMDGHTLNRKLSISTSSRVPQFSHQYCDTVMETQ